MRSWGHLSLKVSDSILDRVDLEGYAGSVSIYVISRPDEIPLSGPLVLYLVVTEGGEDYSETIDEYLEMAEKLSGGSGSGSSGSLNGKQRPKQKRSSLARRSYQSLQSQSPDLEADGDEDADADAEYERRSN